MPNGKPGDHPYTDILHYGSSEFGEPVDGLVKELSKMPGFETVSDEIASILWDHSTAARRSVLIGRQSRKNKLMKATLEKLQAVMRRLASRE